MRHLAEGGNSLGRQRLDLRLDVQKIVETASGTGLVPEAGGSSRGRVSSMLSHEYGVPWLDLSGAAINKELDAVDETGITGGEE